MTREVISIGTVANDGTGDTLRSMGRKINNNLSELYTILGGDSSTFLGNVRFGNNTITFHGTNVNDAIKTVLSAPATKLNSISFPDSSGEVVTTTAEQDLFRKHLYNTKIDGDLRLHGVSGTGYYHFHYEGVVDSGTDLIINFPDLLDSDRFIFADHPATLTNKTLTAPTLTRPIVHEYLADSSGNVALHLTTVASAINHVDIANNSTAGGNHPSVSAHGASTNINLEMFGKGKGSVNIKKASYGFSEMTANGQPDSDSTYIILNKSTALTVNLGNGYIQGEYKIFTNKGAGTATITPANFAQGTSFQLATNEGCQTIWDGSNWFLIGNQGEVTIS